MRKNCRVDSRLFEAMALSLFVEDIMNDETSSTCNVYSSDGSGMNKVGNYVVQSLSINGVRRSGSYVRRYIIILVGTNWLIAFMLMLTFEENPFQSKLSNVFPILSAKIFLPSPGTTAPTLESSSNQRKMCHSP